MDGPQSRQDYVKLEGPSEGLPLHFLNTVLSLLCHLSSLLIHNLYVFLAQFIPSQRYSWRASIDLQTRTFIDITEFFLCAKDLWVQR